LVKKKEKEQIFIIFFLPELFLVFSPHFLRTRLLLFLHLGVNTDFLLFRVH